MGINTAWGTFSVTLSCKEVGTFLLNPRAQKLWR